MVVVSQNWVLRQADAMNICIPFGDELLALPTHRDYLRFIVVIFMTSHVCAFCNTVYPLIYNGSSIIMCASCCSFNPFTQERNTNIGASSNSHICFYYQCHNHEHLIGFLALTSPRFTLVIMGGGGCFIIQ